MGLLEIFFTALILIFPLAEIGRFQLANFAVSLNDIFLSLVIIIWLIGRVKSKTDFKKRSLLKPITLFSLIGFVSLLLNSHFLDINSFFVSFLYLIRWVAYSLIYLVIFDLKPEFRKKIPYLMIFSSFLIVIVGYIQFFFYQNLRNLYYLGWDEHLYRLFSSFFDPNFAGAFFVLSLILISGVILCLIKQKSKLTIYSLSFLAILNLFAVYLTYSRSAFLMLVVGLVTLLILLDKKRWIIFLSIALIVLVFLAPKSFSTEGTNLLRTASGGSRIESARNAVTIISDNPILGVGFNAYRYAQQRYGFIKGASSQTTHSGAGTDNSFLFVLATTGILGFIAYLYLLYKMFVIGYSSRKKNIYSIILISSIIGILVNSLFINSLFYVFIMQWIWILAGLTESN